MSKKEALIVGAGPAGLVAAVNLVREGFSATVWEQEKGIGGNPHWHPSAHDTPVGKKLFEYIGIGLRECFHDYTENFQFILNGNLIDYPASKKNPLYVCERGSRESSIDSTLYRIAEQEGVKFEFSRRFTADDLKHSGDLPEVTILASGLSTEMYEILDIPYTVYAGYFGWKEIEDRIPRASGFFGGFTNEYGYSSTVNGIYYVLLFSRREVPPENLEEFKQMVEKYDKFKFDTWKRFLGYTPKDLRLMHNNRFILTGTLAGVVEPALGFGITGALLSGKISALAAVDKEKGLAEFERFTAGIPAAIAKKKQPGYIGKPPKIGEVWFRFPEGEEKK